MKTYLIAGDDHEMFDEPFNCDLFVEAETPEEALKEWKRYASEAWGVNPGSVDPVRVFEVPAIKTAAGTARALAWHSDVIDVNERKKV